MFLGFSGAFFSQFLNDQKIVLLLDLLKGLELISEYLAANHVAYLEQLYLGLSLSLPLPGD